MSDLEPNDPVWNLLGQAKKVEPSPFFARNVLRQVRLLGDSRKGWMTRLAALFAAPRAIYATAAVAVIAMASVLIIPRGADDAATGNTLSANEESAEAFDPASEIADVEYLGQLMAVADPGQLDDAALADLFF
ncbi:MAG: hypothetical protein JNJ70_12835 [Verrucomicrobiales bacterium]|nr:hypothetical protein [Verrucomicrobiales bacterium]